MSEQHDAIVQDDPLHLVVDDANVAPSCRRDLLNHVPANRASILSSFSPQSVISSPLNPSRSTGVAAVGRQHRPCPPALPVAPREEPPEDQIMLEVGFDENILRVICGHKLLGFSGDSLVGRPLSYLIHPHDYYMLRDVIALLFAAVRAVAQQRNSTPSPSSYSPRIALMTSGMQLRILTGAEGLSIIEVATIMQTAQEFGTVSPAIIMSWAPLVRP